MTEPKKVRKKVTLQKYQPEFTPDKCPICDGDSRVLEIHHIGEAKRYGIECLKCGLTCETDKNRAYFPTPETALAFWDGRVINDRMAKEGLKLCIQNQKRNSQFLKEIQLNKDLTSQLEDFVALNNKYYDALTKVYADLPLIDQVCNLAKVHLFTHLRKTVTEALGEE